MNVVHILNTRDSKKHVKYMTTLIQRCNNDYFPPLSTRGGTRDSDLKKCEISHIGINSYVAELLGQENIFAVSDNRELIGFMSFIHNRRGETIFDCLNYGLNNYISTICVEPNHRNCGVATAMYDFIEEKLPNALCSSFISTRTWSGNENHIHILKRRGYSLIHTKIDDREYNGEKANSVYFVKLLING